MSKINEFLLRLKDACDTRYALTVIEAQYQQHQLARAAILGLLEYRHEATGAKLPTHVASSLRGVLKTIPEVAPDVHQTMVEDHRLMSVAKFTQLRKALEGAVSLFDDRDPSPFDGTAPTFTEYVHTEGLKLNGLLSPDDPSPSWPWMRDLKRKLYDTVPRMEGAPDTADNMAYFTIPLHSDEAAGLVEIRVMLKVNGEVGESVQKLATVVFFGLCEHLNTILANLSSKTLDECETRAQRFAAEKRIKTLREHAALFAGRGMKAHHGE